MFDCSLYSADGIREAADVRHEIIEYQIAQLSLLGYKRDLQFIFPDGYSTPDFNYSDGLPEAPRLSAANQKVSVQATPGGNNGLSSGAAAAGSP